MYILVYFDGWLVDGLFVCVSVCLYRAFTRWLMRFAHSFSYWHKQKIKFNTNIHRTTIRSNIICKHIHAYPYKPHIHNKICCVYDWNGKYAVANAKRPFIRCLIFCIKAAINHFSASSSSSGIVQIQLELSRKENFFFNSQQWRHLWVKKKSFFQFFFSFDNKNSIFFVFSSIFFLQIFPRDTY